MHARYRKVESVVRFKRHPTDPFTEVARKVSDLLMGDDRLLIQLGYSGEVLSMEQGRENFSRHIGPLKKPVAFFFIGNNNLVGFDWLPLKIPFDVRLDLIAIEVRQQNGVTEIKAVATGHPGDSLFRAQIPLELLETVMVEIEITPVS